MWISLQCGRTWDQSLDQEEDPLGKGMATIPVFLPGEFHGQSNLAGYSPWGPKESDTTKWLTLSLSSVWEELTFNDMKQPPFWWSGSQGLGFRGSIALTVSQLPWHLGPQVGRWKGWRGMQGLGAGLTWRLFIHMTDWLLKLAICRKLSRYHSEHSFVGTISRDYHSSISTWYWL